MRLIFVFLSLFFSFSMLAAEFPLRGEYPDVKFITTNDLLTEFGKIFIVDVRSAFEYEIVHIQGAPNIEESKATFVDKLAEAVGGDKSKKIATYCNGYKCKKSFDAVRKAVAGGFTNVFVYDAGIFEWTKAHPEKSFLLGKTPADLKQLISDEMFKKHMLPNAQFEKDAAGANAFLIDARDPSQRKVIPPFASKAPNFPFEKLQQLLDNTEFRGKIAGKTLYIFDAVGKQVMWLQYVLEAKGIKDYFFRESGAE
ncbi:MAG: hypothetical protein A2504_01160 [Bdellovibrionales bacterium RIFOXYD12_FULL_39_22]|nr:MAG: hypothetical protein A2385_02050 [Bdellovibrionales bacterium RIFOXYB1_FULL_39_21]OFZ42716.1 MAG: hypothetical protein A2485_10235 [Bdellovibrionales bacterium RIFOXYC12_FULL_39_17]OFZ47275.1 MAG: hypothetical protein A2404_14840 [Bdellovibrionales bacterium RIFOXYC1_FULL_39_130]OFZ75441.1 MAG: hypothetical protein A2560_04110 [Bdellovibrionales bacterium RIFOXYD1_FULL_39_84]OFZ93395.1 MAG: hypothetical protein A2504_01160 [Bdellovibrionales bacterium RIFOXYD12_FULL_39_22]HLE12366.1 rh